MEESRNVAPWGKTMEKFKELILEVATGFMTATMTSENPFSVLPDEAVDLATDMVGYAFSQQTTTRLQDRISDPGSVAKSVDDQVNVILKRLTTHQSGTAERDAAIYAKAFGAVPSGQH